MIYDNGGNDNKDDRTKNKKNDSDYNSLFS